MKRKISKIISLVLILSLLLGVRTIAIGKKAFVNADNTVTLTDKVDMTAVYVLSYDGLCEKLSEKYNEVIDRETFNIYADESAYDELQSDYGYSDDELYKPENAVRNKLLYIFFMPLVRILECIAIVLLRVIVKFNII